MPALPVVGDVIDLNEESVKVNRVSLNARRYITRGTPVAIVYCRP